MPGPDWPSFEAWNRLEAFEGDPQGYHWIDVERLLELWGVTELEEDEEGRFRVRHHPCDPDFLFRYPLSDEVWADKVIRICEALRILYWRLT